MSGCMSEQTNSLPFIVLSKFFWIKFVIIVA
jgi:hypothetical protein